MGSVRRAGLLAALAAAPVGLAYRFALAYRVRAGFPRRDPARVMPDARGLPYEETTVRSAGLDLPAWFIPARGGAPGPGLVLVHGWESARDRTLPMAAFLHAVGFHCHSRVSGGRLQLGAFRCPEHQRPVVHLVVDGEDIRMIVHPDRQPAHRDAAQQAPAFVGLKIFHGVRLVL